MYFHCSSCPYQRKIDVHLNIWRDIMEFITCRPNQLQKFASILKDVQVAYNFIVLDLGQSLYISRNNVCIAYVVVILTFEYIFLFLYIWGGG